MCSLGPCRSGCNIGHTLCDSCTNHSTKMGWKECILQQLDAVVGLVLVLYVQYYQSLNLVFVSSVPWQEYNAYISSITVKAQAMGQCVVVVPLHLYVDDTSGNRSNKFNHWCFMLAGLPLHENTQLHNIHFVTCSNQVSALDMAGPIVSSLLQLERGARMYDAHLQQEVLVIAPVLAVLADNPRHSEIWITWEGLLTCTVGCVW